MDEFWAPTPEMSTKEHWSSIVRKDFTVDDVATGGIAYDMHAGPVRIHVEHVPAAIHRSKNRERWPVVSYEDIHPGYPNEFPDKFYYAGGGAGYCRVWFYADIEDDEQAETLISGPFTLAPDGTRDGRLENQFDRLASILAFMFHPNNFIGANTQGWKIRPVNE